MMMTWLSGKSDDAKKAQNAKKIADRKAKKPPSDPPAPPERPEPNPKVAVLKAGLEEAMAAAEAKLLEAKTSEALVEAKKEVKIARPSTLHPTPWDRTPPSHPMGPHPTLTPPPLMMTRGRRS